MIDLSKVRNYYVACGYTDLRLGIDGLAAVVTQQYGSHFNEESLFLFCGRRTDRIKALYWCGEGYILLYKRLSNGRFQWPRSEAELRLLDPQSFRWLMEGLRIEQKTAIRKGKPKAKRTEHNGNQFQNSNIHPSHLLPLFCADEMFTTCT